jgi:hypothetical protein
VAGHALRLVCTGMFRQLGDGFAPECVKTEAFLVDA